MPTAMADPVTARATTAAIDVSAPASGRFSPASAWTLSKPTASRPRIATPTERPTHVAIARSRFFHHGRVVSDCTSSASNTECTPEEASHTNPPRATGATLPPFQWATTSTWLWTIRRASGGTVARKLPAIDARLIARRAAASPATAARGTSDRKSQNDISAARPSVRARMTPRRTGSSHARARAVSPARVFRSEESDTERPPSTSWAACERRFRGSSGAGKAARCRGHLSSPRSSPFPPRDRWHGGSLRRPG